MNNKYIDEILEGNSFYAHTKGDSKESLFEHLKLTYKYYKQLEKEKKLENIIKNMIKDVYKDIKDDILNKTYDIFEASIYYHDIGKINPVFQQKKMNNKIKDIGYNVDSKHANLSAAIFFDATMKDILNKYDEADTTFLLYITLYFSFAIARHHTPLTTLSEYIDSIKKVDFFEMYEPIFNIGMLDIECIEEFINRYQIDKISIYILVKLLYSLIVSCDYYATYEYMNHERINFSEYKDKELYGQYRDSSLYHSIRKYEQGKKEVEGINKLRCDMFLEVEKNLVNNLDKNIFYLEAPTGSGKTNMAINISRIFYESIEEINSINYIFPFNNLIEQTAGTFNNYFCEYQDFVVINSITSMVNDTDIKNEEREEDVNYNQLYLKNLFRMYPIKLTSHINLFNTLFGISREANYNLYDFINSVVIIDEIQAYSNSIWREIIVMLDKYASLLNIKFVIMSATLPRLDKLLKETNSKYCNLIEDPNVYYNHSFFRDRVKIEYSLLDKKMELSDLAENIKKYRGKKILVEFIKKSTARNFYNMMKNDHTFQNVYEITGDDNNYTRKQVIASINELNDVLVIATQTIEAGVDIDMDVGFKNISILDSEEQFLGRINRSSKKEYACYAYFFKMDEPNRIYKNDSRLEYNLLNSDMRNILSSKNFEYYYNLVINKTGRNTEKYDSNNIRNLYDACGKNSYKYVAEKMKLIDNKSVQVFFNYTIEYENKKIIGKEIWEAYKELCLNDTISYSKKQVELSKLREKMNLFTYNIQEYISKGQMYYTEEFGGMYYVENGEEFIVDGKFDRQAYLSYSKGMFL
ncbi:MAG: CRISPR-associated helicase Cas3' [Clostridia bacterium]|nr:CRISPR-associated helicase Cas3' [Clostridia bacterium]